MRTAHKARLARPVLPVQTETMAPTALEALRDRLGLRVLTVLTALTAHLDRLARLARRARRVRLRRPAT